MKIAVLSDTHGYFDPRLPPLLRGVDQILHAGDVGSRTVLDQLRAIAPVQAVGGNVDPATLELPPTITRRFGSVEIHMLHELPSRQLTLREWTQASPLQGKPAEHCRRFLQCFPEASRVVVFGHSHEPCVLILAGKLFFNPGSAGKKRFSLPRCFGMLEVSAQGVQATVLSLERYNKGLPEGVWLPVGGTKACGNC